LSCFDENIALQFVKGLLGDERARAVERHAAECSECRWLLGAAAGTTTSETLTTPDARAVASGVSALVEGLLGGDYLVERRIGAGGMGTVYEASHARLPRRFAVKVLVDKLRADPQAVARLRREAEITSRLSHPHIVQVLDFNTTDQGIPFVVMELLEGESLAAFLRREKLIPSVEMLVAILHQATSALGAAHEQGVVHRDLKPNNLFLCRTDDGRLHLKVMDFGISKVMGSTTELTRDSSVLGSPGYMSPEQATGESSEVDARADVFSMGAIIFRMLAGRSPFVAESVPATLYKVVHEKPATTTTWRRVPRALQKVVLRALSKKPAGRQQSMAQLWSEIEEALRSCGHAGLLDAATPGTSSELSGAGLTGMQIARHRRLLFGAAAATLVALGAIITYVSLPSRASEHGAAADNRASTPLSGAGATAGRDGGADSLAVAAPEVVDAGRRTHKRAHRPHRPSKRGYLTVQSKSADGRYLWANVYVDGRKIGQTPILGKLFPAGKHEVQLRRRGYRTVTRRVVLKPGEREVVSLVLRPEPDAPD